MIKASAILAACGFIVGLTGRIATADWNGILCASGLLAICGAIMGCLA